MSNQSKKNPLRLLDMYWKSAFEEYTHTPEQILKMVSFIKDETMALDNFTRELTGFIYELEKKDKRCGNS